MTRERITFDLAPGDSVDRLAELVGAISHAKANNIPGDDEFWENFLDDNTRAAFWWPTRLELEDWEQRWLATPIDQRATAPSLKTPWEFHSLLDAAWNAEIADIEFRRHATGGAIEFAPSAWPFGGTVWIRALIEAFGGRITHDTTTSPT